MSIGTKQTHPVARIEHYCEMCGKRIKVGAKYVRVSGKWEGDWQNWAAHTVCSDIYANADEGVQVLTWRELVDYAPRGVELTRFLVEFPPEDEDDAAWLARLTAIRGPL